MCFKNSFFVIKNICCWWKSFCLLRIIFCHSVAHHCHHIVFLFLNIMHFVIPYNSNATHDASKPPQNNLQRWPFGIHQSHDTDEPWQTRGGPSASQCQCYPLRDLADKHCSSPGLRSSMYVIARAATSWYFRGGKIIVTCCFTVFGEGQNGCNQARN